MGAVLEGKVKSITNFGAFIALPENKTGMVHISEIANAYVSDIRQHLTEGQDVKVMVIAVDPAGKINLSMKRLEPRPQHAGQNGSRPGFHRDGNGGNPHRGDRDGGSFHRDRESGSAPHGQRSQDGQSSGNFHGHSNFRGQGGRPSGSRSSAPTPPAAPKSADQLFEEKLKAFMSESDSKISSIRAYSDHRTKNRRR